MLRNLWDDLFIRYMILILILLGLGLVIFAPSTPDTTVDGEMTFFYLPSCPHCHEQMEFHSELRKEFPELTINSVDASTKGGQLLYVQMLTELEGAPEGIRVPVTIINETVIKGFSTPETTGEQIKDALHGQASTGSNMECGALSDCSKPVELNIFGWDFTINPLDYSLPVLAIILGLVDGFNPCAMWVLVYLISLVVMLDNKKRAWLLLALFLAASGILYFLFMSLWLNVFLFIGYLRPVQIIIGLFALGVGLANLREYIITKGPLACKVGDLKGKKKTMDKAKSIINAPLTIVSIFGMVILAFAVNSIEFMCSFGIPAVFSEVLAVSSISHLTKYGLIGLYVLMYMIDDLIIFALAIFAVQSSFGDKYAKQCKMIAGAILVLLGVILLFFPGLLASFG